MKIYIKKLKFNHLNVTKNKKNNKHIMTTREQITLLENYNKSQYDTDSDLELAIRFSKLGNNLEIAKTLLENHGDINKQDTNGRSLLINSLLFIADFVDTEIIKLILEKGADVNKTSHPIIPIINKLTSEGTITKELSDDFMKLVNKKYCVYIPLLLCGYQVDIIKLLLEKGANINEQNKIGYTLLISSTRSQYTEAIKLVLEYKPDVDIMSNNDRTALYYAIANYNIESIKLLLDAGAYMYSKNGSDSPFKLVLYDDICYNRSEATKLFFEKRCKNRNVNK